jgi:hypothetical protein
MTNIEERFAGNGDDGRLIERQLLGRPSVKSEPRSSPAKNRIANPAPVRFRWNFNDDDSRFVASRILKRNMNVAVLFNFQSNDAPGQSKSVVFDSGAL